MDLMGPKYEKNNPGLTKNIELIMKDEQSDEKQGRSSSLGSQRTLALLLLLIYAQLDGKMERNLDGWTKQYNNEEI